MTCALCGVDRPFLQFTVPAEAADIDGIRLALDHELRFCGPSCRSLWLANHLLDAHLLDSQSTEAAIASAYGDGEAIRAAWQEVVL